MQYMWLATDLAADYSSIRCHIRSTINWYQFSSVLIYEIWEFSPYMLEVSV